MTCMGGETLDEVRLSPSTDGYRELPDFSTDHTGFVEGVDELIRWFAGGFYRIQSGLANENG